MCKKLLISTIKKQKDIHAPIRIFPTCHPKASLDVHVDGLGGIIYLSCSKCDRLIEKIKVPKYTLPQP